MSFGLAPPWPARHLTGACAREDRQKYLSLFLTNFNAAVAENALKWRAWNPGQGNVNYKTVDAVLAWTDEHHLPLRGHNIFWGVPDRVQDWLKATTDDELREALRNRALDIGRRYRGRFAEYDLNNEMIHGNYYEQRLGQRHHPPDGPMGSAGRLQCRPLS